MAVIVEVEKLDIEGRIVGKNTYGVIVDFKPAPYGFEGDAARLIGNKPMEPRYGELIVKGRIGYVDIIKKAFRFG